MARSNTQIAFGISSGLPRSSLTSAGRNVARAGQSTPAVNGLRNRPKPYSPLSM